VSLIDADDSTDGLSPAAAASASIPVRRVSFADPLDGLTRHFAKDENIVVSHMMVQLSILFPAGEEFFVRSVRAYRDQITDPVLKRKVANFIGQETVHGREHREMNDKFEQLGYPTHRIDKRLDKRLKKVSETVDPMQCLAVTVALEHFTAVLAEMLLGTDAREHLGDEGIQSIFLWHALEESEHKSVAFDVYASVGGSEKMRTQTMNVIMRTFVARTVFMTIVSLLRDRATFQRGRLRRDLMAALRSPLFKKSVWTSLRDFNRAGFHPNDHETDALVDQWREELFGPDGTLTAYLGAAARNA